MSIRSWRSRGLIESRTILKPGEYPVRNAKLIVRPFEEANITEHSRLVDLLLDRGSEVEAKDVFIRSLDIINEFLDRVALVGYSPVGLVSMISTVPLSVKVGDEFPLIMMVTKLSFGVVELGPEDLTGFDAHSFDSLPTRACRLIRDALSTDSVEEKYLRLYSALEQIAESETTERIRNRCPKCRTLIDGPLATANYIKRLIHEGGGDPGKAREWRELRSRVAHGGGLRNMAFLEEIAGAITGIEAACLGVVAARNAVTIRKTDSAVLGLPITEYRCSVESDRTFKVLEGTFGMRVGRTKILLRASREPQPESVVGMSFPTPEAETPFPPLVWPSISD